MIAKERTPPVINHAHYSELCSLAAAAFAVSGQLSHAECNDLMQHLPDCADCQELMRNFVQVSFEIRPARDANHSLAGSASNGGLQRLSLSPPYLGSSVTVVESTAEDLGKTPRTSRLGSVGRWTTVASTVAILIVIAIAVAFQQGMLSPRQVQPSNENQHADSVGADPMTRAQLEESAA